MIPGLLEIIGLMLAAFAAGGLNAVAGGGSFLVFPALLLAGLNPLMANATNTVALWPGSIAAAYAYRHRLAGAASRGSATRRLLWPLLGATVAGSTLGAVLLLGTPEQTFRRLVPWLMLAATLVFCFGDALTRRMARRARHADGALTRPALILGATAMLVISVYIGYFGAGAGIILLACFTVLDFGDIHAMNGLKTVLAAAGNGIAVVAFAVAGLVAWPEALLMAAVASAGGWLGARWALKVEPARIRRIVAVLGLLITIALFQAA